MIYLWFIINIFSSLLILNSKPKKDKLIEGVVEFQYVKDTGKANFYWLSSKVLKTRNIDYYLIEDDTDIAGAMFLVCEDSLTNLYKGLELTPPLTSIYEVENYQNQNAERSDFYTHYGGDIYELNKDTLVISFVVKARALLFNHKPCELDFPPFHSCPVEQAELFFPIVVILDVDEVVPLPNSYLKKKGYKPYGKQSFPKMECS